MVPRGGGKITVGKLLDICGMDGEAVDPRFLPGRGTSPNWLR